MMQVGKVMSACSSIVESTSGEMGADDLVPWVVYCVVQAKAISPALTSHSGFV